MNGELGDALIEVNMVFRVKLKGDLVLIMVHLSKVLGVLGVNYMEIVCH